MGNLHEEFGQMVKIRGNYEKQVKVMGHLRPLTEYTGRQSRPGCNDFSDFTLRGRKGSPYRMHKKMEELIERNQKQVRNLSVPPQMEEIKNLMDQASLIESILKRIPDTVQYPEYPEYLKRETKGAANEFLNAVLKQEKEAENIRKLVTYMSERPGVVKLGKHGLFSQTDDPIDLEAAAENVGNHTGYIWTHIVSLHREVAERLGYNNAESWKSLIRRNVTTIAEAHKIQISDLQWYAAFHDTGHHPHIHLMVYSKGQEGYLSKKRIDSLRSCFGNDIFKQEQYHPFQLHTDWLCFLKSERKPQDKMFATKISSYFSNTDCTICTFTWARLKKGTELKLRPRSSFIRNSNWISSVR